MTDKRVEPIEADDIYQLADSINEFSKTADIFSTQIYPRLNSYDCLIWYNKNKPENIYKKEEVEELATEKQINFLNRLEINIPKGLTKKDANLLIQKQKVNEEINEVKENKIYKKEVKKEPEIEEPMTSKQWGKLKSLGVNAPKGTTKKEAIILIKEALGEDNEKER